MASGIAAKIVKSANSLAKMPFKAPVEEYLAGRKFVYRALSVRKIFKVVYFIDEEARDVVIATIWDCRRDPSGLRDEIAEN